MLALTLVLLLIPGTAFAQEKSVVSNLPMDVHEFMEAAGTIGMLTIVLSVAVVALVIEFLFRIRRGAFMPHGLAEDTYHLIQQGQFQQAQTHCRENGSFLGYVLAAGLGEHGLGYASMEKAMEDASAEQAARFFRRIEYLSVIGTIAPMLGLLGTVWGMMLAFLEFKAKANVQAADLAPGIAHALVTTFIGLVVAIPAFAAFAYFRNRIDELVAASAQLAEHVFADYRRNQALRRRKKQTGTSNPAAARPPVPPVTYNVPSLGKPDAARPPIPSVTIEKGKIERDKTG